MVGHTGQRVPNKEKSLDMGWKDEKNMEVAAKEDWNGCKKRIEQTVFSFLGEYESWTSGNRIANPKPMGWDNVYVLCKGMVCGFAQPKGMDIVRNELNKLSFWGNTNLSQPKTNGMRQCLCLSENMVWGFAQPKTFSQLFRIFVLVLPNPYLETETMDLLD